MKHFSKSKLCWILTFSVTCLLAFVCAFVTLAGNNKAFVNAEGETTATLEITYDYAQYPTLEKLDELLSTKGYTFADTVVKSTPVSVGTHTFSALPTGGGAAEDIVIKVNAPAVKKVEDIVTGTDQFQVGVNNVAMTAWRTDGEELGNSVAVYAINNDDTQNGNTYGGNLSLYGTAAAGSGVVFNGQKAVNKFGLMQMRTKYTANANYLFGLMRSAGKYQFYHEYATGGYHLRLTSASKVGVFKCETDANTRKTLQALVATTQKVTEGTQLVVTYGIYPETIDGSLVNVIKFKGESSDGAITYFDLTINDTNPTQISVLDENKSVYFNFGIRAASPYTPITVEGVNKPLFSSFASNYSLSGEYAAGAALSSINTLPAGMTFKNLTDVIEVGENTATATVDYYNTGNTFDTTITFTGKYAYTQNKELSYNDYVGKKLSDITLDSGFAFAPEDLDKLIYVGEKEYVGTYTDGVTQVPALITLNVTAPSVKKIESLVDSYDDINVGVYSAIRDNWIEQGKAAEGTSYAIFTDTSTVVSGKTYVNANRYSGNISLHSNEKTYGAGITLKNSDMYGLVQFRTYYNAKMIYSFGTEKVAETIHFGYGKEAGGYNIFMNQNDAVYLGKNILEQTAGADTPDDTSDDTYSYYDQKYYTTNLSANGKIAEDAAMLVTYGTYPILDSEGAECIAIYVKCEVDGAVVFEHTRYDATPDTTVHRGENANYFSIGYKTASGNSVDATQYAMSIEGVDQPLFTTGRYDTSYTDAVDEKQAISAVTVENYTWKEPNTQIDYNTKEYAAEYVLTYHGNQLSLDAMVTLTNINPVQRVLLQINDGSAVQKYALNNGETYTFTISEDEKNALDGTFIGWLSDDGMLVKNGFVYTATVTEGVINTTYAAQAIDFKMLEKASVRTTVNEKGNGGLRFAVMFDSADWTTLASYIDSAYGVIVPKDDVTYYNEGFTAAAYAIPAGNPANSFKGMTAFTAEELGLEGDEYNEYSLYTFALTNIKYQNYNREFAAMTYITIKYADGSTANFETSNFHVSSVYEVAQTAIKKGATSEVVRNYIANVIEVQIVDGEEVSQTDITGGIVPVGNRAYTVDNAIVNENEITLEISVTADSKLDKIIAELPETGKFAPVYVNHYDSVLDQKNVKRYKATVESYADGKLTVKFSVQ